MRADVISRVWDLLDTKYYDSDEFEHVREALETVLENEDEAFQKRVLRKVLREVRNTWEQEAADARTYDPEQEALARRTIVEIDELLRELR